MRGEDIMGKITGICISEKRGVQKHFIEEANIIADWGIEGDAHGGKWHRQISLLSQEKVDAFKAKGADIHPGSFGENLIVEGFDFSAMPRLSQTTARFCFHYVHIFRNPLADSSSNISLESST